MQNRLKWKPLNVHLNQQAVKLSFLQTQCQNPSNDLQSLNILLTKEAYKIQQSFYAKLSIRIELKEPLFIQWDQAKTLKPNHIT